MAIHAPSAHNVVQCVKFVLPMTSISAPNYGNNLANFRQWGSSTVSITPKFANSKILITLNSNMAIINNASELIWELYRDSTGILVSAGAFNNTANYFGWMYAYAGGGAQYRSLSASHVDTPNTTSTITYKPYHLRKSGAECTSLHWGSQMVMTLTEIKV